MEALLILAGMIGIAVGLIAGRVIEIFRDRTIMNQQECALREIADHQWDTGKHNDAVVVTRIAMRGLKGV